MPPQTALLSYDYGRIARGNRRYSRYSNIYIASNIYINIARYSRRRP